MLTRRLRRWLNNNPTLTHVSGGMWWVLSAQYVVSTVSAPNYHYNKKKPLKLAGQKSNCLKTITRKNHPKYSRPHTEIGGEL